MKARNARAKRRKAQWSACARRSSAGRKNAKKLQAPPAAQKHKCRGVSPKRRASGAAKRRVSTQSSGDDGRGKEIKITRRRRVHRGTQRRDGDTGEQVNGQARRSGRGKKRSEERRVGKEWRARWGEDQGKKKRRKDKNE